jgi:hypothetical protein
MSKPHMLAPESQETYNLYTIHKQGLPGFRYLPESSSYVVLFPDDRLGLAPLRKNILHQKRHEDGAEYSREILDVIPASKIAGIPIPLLGPFFSGQCAGYLGTNHPMFAMAAERLVDGMDLDEEWCRQHISERFRNAELRAHSGGGESFSYRLFFIEYRHLFYP